MGKIKSPFEAWLDKPMQQDKGLHRDLFVAAAYLLEEGHTAGEVFAMLRTATSEVEDRFTPDREIYSAIDYAHRRITGAATPGMIWPPFDQCFWSEVLKLYPTDMQKLKAQIPAPRPAIQFLRSLYLEADLLCIGKTSSEFRTVRLSEIPMENKDLWTCEFINPSPMSSVAGLTMDGEWSEHAKANTGPRVYSVIEFDSGEPHEHASILKYLATKLPLVMIVYSGGSSLHGWFKTSHAGESMIEAFYQEAVCLGADPKMFSPCQFSRLPMGRHATTGRLQRVIFFNPNRVYHQ